MRSGARPAVGNRGCGVPGVGGVLCARHMPGERRTPGVRGVLRVLGLAAPVGLAGLARLLRPWQTRWGATDDEVAAPLPGDDLLPGPAEQVTRAITVAATPAGIWPWLVQVGADRGGFYSYDRLENLFGLGIHSAEAVVDEWQDLAEGDLVRANRSGSGGWVVVRLVPQEALVLQVADVATRRPLRRDEPPGWAFQWTFALRPAGGGTTRLLIRERTAFGKRTMRWLMAPVGPVSFLMTRKMLLGIKARAERAGGAAHSPPAPGSAVDGTVVGPTGGSGTVFS